jgi:hypothetical protein
LKITYLLFWNWVDICYDMKTLWNDFSLLFRNTILWLFRNTSKWKGTLFLKSEK